MAVEKWQRPPTITALRGFLGFANYYASNAKEYAEIVAPLQDLLKVGKSEGKEGSKLKVVWCDEAEGSFKANRRALCEALELQTVNADMPFVLRVDASGRAMRAALEQSVDGAVLTVEEMLRPGTTKPVAFMSRNLTSGHFKGWDARDKEAYAILSALDK